jgi:hypothetical protein
MTQYTESDVRHVLAAQAAGVNVDDGPAVLERFHHQLHRRHRRSIVLAVVATTAVVVATPAVLATTLPHRVGSAGPSTLSYQSVCRHEPDACLSKASGMVPAALLRTPRLPTRLPPDDRCPATTGGPSDSRYVTGLEFGTGPVRMIFGDRGEPHRGRIALGRPESSSPQLAAENVLLIGARYRGPLALRGRQLDGPGIAHFDGDNATFIDPPYPDANTQPDGSRTPPATVFVPNPGCYAFQFTGTDFAETIVIQLTAPRR